MILSIHEHEICFHLLCLIQIISLMSDNFQNTVLSVFWLTLYLGISVSYLNREQNLRKEESRTLLILKHTVLKEMSSWFGNLRDCLRLCFPIKVSHEI